MSNPTTPYDSLVAQYAEQAGVSPALAVGIVRQEFVATDSVSKAGAVGIMQVLPTTAMSLFPSSWATTQQAIDAMKDPDVSAQVGVAYIQQLQNNPNVGNDPAHLAAAYYSGPGVQQINGVWVTSSGTPGGPPTVQSYVDSVTQNSKSAATTPPPTTVNFGVDNSNAAPAVPISGQNPVPAATQAAANPSLVITTGLDEVAWFNDPGVLKVNGATAAVDSPITFQVYFDPNNTFGTNGAPLSTNGFTGTPITIKLNASVQSFERELKHVATRRTTRTGMLVTLWGMAPDMIVASGSTGVFMNQLGLTDFLSLSSLTDDAKQILQSGFAHAENLSTDPSQDFIIALNQNTGSGSLPARLSSASALRIAAKDAFMEFMGLFRNNGVVWYHSQTNAGSTVSQEQLAPLTWSPTTGASTYQMNARNNDVLTRGTVSMRFRNSIYYGYFKSLSFSMDANNPFRWVFNFAFKVERTVTEVFIPSPVTQ